MNKRCPLAVTASCNIYCSMRREGRLWHLQVKRVFKWIQSGLQNDSKFQHPPPQILTTAHLTALECVPTKALMKHGQKTDEFKFTYFELKVKDFRIWTKNYETNVSFTNTLPLKCVTGYEAVRFGTCLSPYPAFTARFNDKNTYKLGTIPHRQAVIH
jgi:hypothetical protein